MVHVSFWLDAEVHARLTQLAAERDTTLTTLFRRFTENYLATDGKMQETMQKFGEQRAPVQPAKEKRRGYRRRRAAH